MRPRAYKEGKVYSVLPIDGGADFTFARATTATNHNGGRINSGKDLEYVGNNVPKLHHLYGACPYLGLEPAATNLLPESEDFSTWQTDANRGDVEGGHPSPDGDNNAYKLTTNQEDRALRYKFVTPSGANGTFSVFVKNISDSDENRAVKIRVSNATIDFVLDNEYFNQISTDVIDYGYEKLDNGWYRLFVSTNNMSDTYYSFAIAITGDGFFDNQGEGIYIFGAQFEATPYLTSYIPTDGQSVSRTEETMYKDNLSNYINSSEGVLYAELQAFAEESDADRYIYLGDSSKQNFVSIVYQATGGVLAAYGVRNNNESFYIGTTDYTLTDNLKIAVKWKENDCQLYVNGNLVGTDNSTEDFNFTFTDLKSSKDSNQAFYGKVRDLRVYKTALTTDELTELTS
jgi:hypothetical protein